ncbi:MAG: single-stranded-DNA-specific exonuclease RecJ [Cryomorphaceae bacterium]|nr:single-stranded-DNA-specific exonuclease RecJ [Cryomorphaceae bacterium]
MEVNVKNILKRWVFPSKQEIASAKSFANAWNTSEVIAMLMVKRGLISRCDHRPFFIPSLGNLHAPELMKDMDKAVNRLADAIQKKEKIMIFGDYDVDGTTSVALLASFFSKRYPNFITYIPDRYKEGYGLSTDGIEYALQNQCGVLVALDCGIKSVEKVAWGQKRGIDFIICDHHTPGAKLPPAIAVLDPKRKDCQYPFDELSGCGVGFKLLCALSKKMNWPESEVFDHLDLLALSIGADIVPITGENRILAHFGLQRIKMAPRPGIKALIDVSKRKINTIDDVVFSIAPRINAAGRIEHGSLAVKLLSTQDEAEANTLAEQVDLLNRQRRTLDQEITEEAIEQVVEKLDPNAAATVVYNDDWHKGVIGIVASRLIERYYRPTIVLTKSGDVYAGSARSVEGFDLYEALDTCKDQLIQFGGHKYAAGMTVEPEKVADFAKAFERVVKDRISEAQKTPAIYVDAVLPFDAIGDQLRDTLQRMHPFGPKNMKPVFVTRKLVLGDASRCVGEDEKHLKLQVVDPDTGICMDGIAFGMGHLLPDLKSAESFHLAYHLEENHWNGKVSLQLHVLDIQFPG